MRIHRVNYNFQSNKIEKNTQSYRAASNKSISFEGALTRIVQKRLTFSTDSFQFFSKIYARDKGIVGIIPPEFVNAIKSNLGMDYDLQKLKKCIGGTRDTFSEVAKKLEKVEDKILSNERKYIQEMNLDDFLKEIKENLKWKILEVDSPEQLELQNRLRQRFNADPMFIKNIEAEASKILEDGLIQNKVIPNDAKVILKKLNDGNTGAAYKISVVDKNGQNIFIEKVIKYYKDTDAIFKNRLELSFKKIDILKNNFGTIMQKIDGICDSFSEKEFPAIKKERAKLCAELDILKTKTIDDCRDIISQGVQKQKESYKSEDGIHKEAMLSSYVRKNIGHRLKKSDLVNPFYVDLNNKYSISNFSSIENLGSVTKKNSYESLGLSFIDLIGKIHNIEEGRLIDYGGYIITNKILAENPVARKFYKKIEHIKGKNSTQNGIDKINELYEKTLQNRIAQSSDVILGLKEARNLVPEKFQSQLKINI